MDTGFSTGFEDLPILENERFSACLLARQTDLSRTLVAAGVRLPPIPNPEQALLHSPSGA